MNATPSSRPAQTGQPCRIARPAARAFERGRAVCAPAHDAVSGRTRGGFTLAEILIAMALLVIVGGLAVANLVHISSSFDTLSPDKALLTAIRQARFLALQRMSPVALSFNNEELTFDIVDDKGIVLEQIKSNVDPDASEFTLTFTPILPLKDTVTEYKTEMEEQEYSRLKTSRLVFHGTGVTAPVKVSIRYDLKDIEFLLDAFSEGPPPKPLEATAYMN